MSSDARKVWRPEWALFAKLRALRLRGIHPAFGVDAFGLFVARVDVAAAVIGANLPMKSLPHDRL